jgi:hypothetical protein
MGNCGLFPHLKPGTASEIAELPDAAVYLHRRRITPEMGDIRIWTGARSFVYGPINASYFALSVQILAKAPKGKKRNKPALLAIYYFNGNRIYHYNIITKTTGS